MAIKDRKFELDLDCELERLAKLVSEGQPAEILQICTDLLEYFPDIGTFYFNRGQARHALGDKIAALDDMSRAVELMPGAPAPFFFRGLWCLETGAYAEAIRDLSRTITLEEGLNSNSYAVNARFLRSMGHVLLGELEPAMRDIKGLSCDSDFRLERETLTAGDLKAQLADRDTDLN